MKSMFIRNRSLVFKKAAIAKLSLTDMQQKAIVGGGDDTLIAPKESIVALDTSRIACANPGDDTFVNPFDTSQ